MSNNVDMQSGFNDNSVGSLNNNSTYKDTYYSDLSGEQKIRIQNLEKQLSVLKSILSDVKDPKIMEYLSEQEKKTLESLNKVSNTLNNQTAFIKDILNKPIHEILQNWSLSQQHILHDLIKVFENKNIIEEIQNDSHWWNPIFKTCKQIYDIFSKDDRMIYMGMTIVFIALILVFVNITETKTIVQVVKE